MRVAVTHEQLLAVYFHENKALSSHLCDRARRVEILSCDHTGVVAVHYQVSNSYCITNPLHYLILFILSLVDLARSRSDENAFCLRWVSVSSQLRSSTSLEPVAALSDRWGLIGYNFTSNLTLRFYTTMWLAPPLYLLFFRVLYPNDANGTLLLGLLSPSSEILCVVVAWTLCKQYKCKYLNPKGVPVQ